jgi:hypothetical protein
MHEVALVVDTDTGAAMGAVDTLLLLQLLLVRTAAEATAPVPNSSAVVVVGSGDGATKQESHPIPRRTTALVAVPTDSEESLVAHI